MTHMNCCYSENIRKCDVDKLVYTLEKSASVANSIIEHSATLKRELLAYKELELAPPSNSADKKSTLRLNLGEIRC
jgi:hypothetical protein